MLEKIRILFGFKTKRPYTHITVDTVDRILSLKSYGMKQSDIAQALKISESVVSRVCNGKHKLTKRN